MLQAEQRKGKSNPDRYACYSNSTVLKMCTEFPERTLGCVNWTPQPRARYFAELCPSARAYYLPYTSNTRDPRNRRNRSCRTEEETVQVNLQINAHGIARRFLLDCHALLSLRVCPIELQSQRLIVRLPRSTSKISQYEERLLPGVT